MNPLLPAHIHIPDGEARVWADGRLYLYGSFDIGGDTFYCSQEHYVFSSNDLVHWQEYPLAFHSRQAHFPDRERLFAPDCICRDGKYYLLYCGSGNTEGIAVSDRPEGPFGNAYPVPGADGDAIDPCGLVDDGGQVYYFWGQFHLRGARMSDDLKGLDESTLNTHLLTEEKDGFHEGSSIRKRNGLYYMVYTDISRGKASCFGYAVSKYPLGPYQKKGIIIDNDGCDPETWNNHGSIAEFKGQWCVFYHRSSRGTKYSRRMCAEPIFFNDDGTIDEVEMTTQGVEGPLPADKPIEAWRACLLSGQVRTGAVEAADNNGIYYEYLTQIQDGDWAAYKYIDLTKGIKHFKATAAAAEANGHIEVRLDSPEGDLFCTCPVPATGGWMRWQQIEAELVKQREGVHAVYLVFRGNQGDQGRLFDLLGLCFY